MSAQRADFTILLGLFLTPLAGFLGVISSAFLPLWLFGLLGGPAVIGVLSLVTMLKGAWYAWPLTCVILPLVAVFLRPVTHISVLAFVLIGLMGGPLSFAFISWMSDSSMHPDSFRSFAIASASAGTILGAIFGFALWRYDKIMEQTKSVGSKPSAQTVKLGIVLGTTFLMVALVGLMLAPQHDKCSSAEINRDKIAKTFLDFECDRLRRN
jgi:hypothetical protein